MSKMYIPSAKWTELCVSTIENLLTEVYSGTRTALLICVWLAACAGSVAKNNKLLARHELRFAE